MRVSIFRLYFLSVFTKRKISLKFLHASLKTFLILYIVLKAASEFLPVESSQRRLVLYVLRVFFPKKRNKFRHYCTKNTFSFSSPFVNEILDTCIPLWAKDSKPTHLDTLAQLGWFYREKARAWSSAAACTSCPTSGVHLRQRRQKKHYKDGFFIFFKYLIQHCFNCRPSDSTVSEDAEIEPRTGATLALTVRRSDHSARDQILSSWLGDIVDSGIGLSYTGPPAYVAWRASTTILWQSRLSSPPPRQALRIRLLISSTSARSHPQAARLHPKITVCITNFAKFFKDAQIALKAVL